jgi:hypothetical protein
MTYTPHEQLYAPPHPTNGLAIAGFIVSLVGLFATGGLLCPIGLILSLVALGKPFGRGWAVAGIVIGLIGSCGWLALWLVVGAAILAAVGIAIGALAVSQPEKTEVTYDMVRIHEAVESNEKDTGFLPASLGSLSLAPDVLTDPWGGAYRYVLDTNESGFDIISDGKDLKAGTPDDVYFSKLDKLWNGTKFDFKIDGGKEGGSVVIDLGESSVKIKGDEEGGRISLDTGDKVIEIKGDHEGGNISSSDEPAPEAPPTPAPGDDKQTADEPAHADEKEPDSEAPQAPE